MTGTELPHIWLGFNKVVSRHCGKQARVGVVSETKSQGRERVKLTDALFGSSSAQETSQQMGKSGCCMFLPAVGKEKQY